MHVNVLVFQGEEGHHMFVVEEGSLEVIIDDEVRCHRCFFDVGVAIPVVVVTVVVVVVVVFVAVIAASLSSMPSLCQ